MTAYVLVVNAGSSSLKYSLVDGETGESPASGSVERIGESSGRLAHDVDGEKHTEDREFETFEDALGALEVGGISEPVVTRFGVHLIQVVDRRQVTLDAKQQREQARNILREQKFEEAYAEWLRDLRGRAYIEMREPPQ